MTRDLTNEESTLVARKQICEDLAASEQQQAAAAENLVANHNATRAANQRLGEAERRARIAEDEQRKATHELRRREAEAKATAAAAAAAQEALDHAIQFHQQRTSERDSAVAHAHECATDSRNCELSLTQAQAAEHTAASIYATVHGEATTTQIGYGGIGSTRAYSALRYPAHPHALGYTAGPRRGEVAVQVGADGLARVAL
jgi:hypothetical protein